MARGHKDWVKKFGIVSYIYYQHTSAILPDPFIRSFQEVFQYNSRMSSCICRIFGWIPSSNPEFGMVRTCVGPYVCVEDRMRKNSLAHIWSLQPEPEVRCQCLLSMRTGYVIE